ncbi:methyl-accepting chemotaxis protein [Halobellus clavatus]|uniref:Methyl-accepting chemotaxis protein n=1 Tax=Halobellus clavatus TaxID=660517 RepID=A0A1H3IKF0_9EURY|nr:methyl-accepting chemotaxis protein [Halobellus clavatus]SDY28256.1 methyl-accepting chemotaxis protein [Halobellus clavatus]
MRPLREIVIPAMIRKRWAVKSGIAIFVILLFIGSVGAVTYVETNEELSQDAQIRLETAAETQSVSLSEWVQQMRTAAQTLAYSAPVQSGDSPQISAYLSQQLEDGKLPSDVVVVHYLDTQTGIYRASSESEAVGANAAVRGIPWMQRSLDLGENGVRVSEPYEDPNTQTAAAAVIAAVPNQENRVLVMVIDLESYAAGLPRPLQDSFTKVVDSDGTTVLSHRTDEILTQNMGASDTESVDSMAVKNGLDGQSGYMEMEMSGTEMAMGYAPVAGTDWVVMIHSPTSTLFALQQQISQNLLILLGGALLGFAVLGVTIGRNTISELNRLTSKAQALEDGDLDVAFESARVDEIGQLYGAFGGMRDALRERIREAEREKQRSAELVDHLEAKADAYSSGMERAADGELTVRVDPESENAAMTQIGEAFNAMVGNIEETVVEIRSFADRVAVASEEVTAGTAESQSASEQMNASIQDIAADAESQSANLQEVAAEMQDLSGTIEEVASSVDEMATKSQQTATLGEEGRESATAALEEMDAIESQAEQTITEVESLAGEMDEIGEIVEVITDIAEQTNMLALNASIEATQANNGGEGFAVIADEIKELAQEVADSTDEIEGLITDIQASTDEVVGSIREMGERVEDGAATTEDASAALRAIADNVEASNQSIQEISDATDAQASSTEEVASMVDQVSTKAERVNEESDTVSAAAQEQTASLTQVAQSAETLADQADELQAQLAAFTVSETESPTPEPQSGGLTRSETAADGGSLD